jgi:hypothetical protein
MRRWGAVSGHWAALAAIVALALLLFPRAVFRGEAFYERDVQLVWHSQVEAFVSSIHAGSWPVWNPFLSFGHPLLANPHTQVLYPFTWLNLVLPAWTLYTVFVVSHLAFAGAGLYLLARFLGLSRAGGLVAAACWMASGPCLSLANMWIQMGGASWIPWVLLAAGRALESRRAVPAVLWGAAGAMQLFAGSPDMSVMTAAAAAAWTLASIRPGSSAGAPDLRVLAAAAVACAFAAALSAALWLPALELTRGSARWSMESAQRAVWSVHPLGLAEVFSPVPLTDLPIHASLRGALYDGGLPLMHALYLGGPALALVAAAFGGAASRARTAAVAGLAAAAVFALGRHTPVYEIAVALVPPLRVLRFPSKAMVLVAFAWALLAGIGFDRWRSADAAAGRRWLATVAAPLLALAAGAGAIAALLRWRPGLFQRALAPSASHEGALTSASLALAVMASLAAVVAVAAIARWRRPRVAPALAGVVASVSVLDLVVAGLAVNPTVPVEFFRFRPPIRDAVSQADLSRLFVYRYPLLGVLPGSGPAADDPYRIARYPPGLSLDAGRALAARLYLMPPAGGCWDLFGSYEPDLIGLYPAHVAELVGWMERSEGTPDYSRFLRLGAVRHVSSLRRHGGFEDLDVVGVYPSLLARPILLFEVPGTLPRSYVVGTARAADGEAARRVLLDPGFDIRREAVLPDASFAAGPGFAGTSRVVDMRPDRVRVEVELSEPGLLILVDTYDPGWKATVDGRPEPLLRTNVAFRGVRVPAGRHVVEQVYRPGTVVYGLWTSGAAALAGLAVALAGHRRGAAPDL